MERYRKRIAEVVLALVFALAAWAACAPAYAEDLPSADLFNADFSDGTAKDTVGNTTASADGQPVIADNSEVGYKVASFDGDSAYKFAFGQQYGKISDTLTLEALVKFDELPTSGEHDFFSNQQGGGAGLGIDGGKLVLFAHVNGSYREPGYAVSNLKANTWYHVVGLVDGQSVKLYVDGQLVDSVDAGGTGIKMPANETAQNLCIGGDSSNDNGTQFRFNGSVAIARAYSAALTDAQVKALSDKAHEGVTQPANIPQQINLGLVSTPTAAHKGKFNLNLHANEDNAGSIDAYEFDVAYDPTRLSYLGDAHCKDGVTIEKTSDGILHVKATGSTLSTSAFSNYGATRLDKLTFQATDESGETTVEVKNFKAYQGDTEVTDRITAPTASQTIAVAGTTAHDYNGDGLVSVADVALAPEADRKATAKVAKYYPYKHVVVLTMDGGGQCFRPDAIYYASSASTTPKKTSDASIMAKRNNPYCVDLFNNKFAVTYTATSVNPPISAQNYSSMLHGVKWDEADSSYQVDNSSTGKWYYPDFMAQNAKYPSIFKAFAEAYPSRNTAAFSEWSNILDGIIEPDAQTYTQDSASLESFEDVADYVKSDDFDNTGIVYMQSDYMDHIGHSYGFYTDTYYDELQRYDAFFKDVMDALEDSGHADDTLLICNVDHGGHGYSHGDYNLACDRDIQIALGGHTVKSGQRLSGGNNSDIASLVLNALDIKQPSSMTGSVFDDRAFLSQDELAEAGKDTEGSSEFTYDANAKRASLAVTDLKQDVSVVDAVINLKGAKASEVKAAKGATILSEKEEDGKLHLTVKVSGKPHGTVVTMKLAGATFRPKASTVILATAQGTELVPALENSKGTVSTQKSGKAVKHAKAITVNAKTVTAKTLTSAAKKAKTSAKYVTKVTLGTHVKSIKKGAFKKFKKAKTIVVKTKKLTRASVKGGLKGSHVKAIKVQVSKAKKANAKYVKSYKAIFTKANCGKKVSVRAA
ncbi:MAG: LamG-like jellyroll fold domain-containing protein [Eggerthellaceae bacterium]|jgi:hypothetical protein